MSVCVLGIFRYCVLLKKTINFRTLKRHLQSFEVVINRKVIQTCINSKDSKFNAVLDPYNTLMCKMTFYLNV